MTPLPCHHCKIPPTDVSDEWQYAYVCEGCYDADAVGDPLEHVTYSVVGSGHTREAAIEDWNAKTEEKITT